MTSDAKTCAACGADSAQIRHVTRTYGKGDELLVVEHVPIVSCSHCGESYLEASTLHELERIKANRRSTTRRPIAVAQFS